MTEIHLDNLMEDLLKDKQFKLMQQTLEQVKPTYSKYEFYKKELEAYKVLDEYDLLEDNENGC